MRKDQAPQNRACYETKINRHAPDFSCSIVGPGHKVHTDPRTGVRWAHPARPYGVRRKYK